MSRRHSLLRCAAFALEARVTPAIYTVDNVANSGVGSLRQAILDANGNAGADDIAFDPVVFKTAQTIVLNTGVLSITGPTTVTGPAVGVTLKNTLAGAHVIDVYLAPTGTVVDLENLTITGGGATAGLTAGVYATGQTLTLTRCILTGNVATNGVGAVSVNGGSLTLRDCTVSNNTGTTSGGITNTNGSVFVENCTVVGNTSTGNAGGGIRYFGTPGVGGVTILNSTIVGNTGVNAGGGIGFSSFTGTALIRNCTVTGNVLSGGTGGGGGIGRLAGSTGTINIAGCIVSGNTFATSPDIFSTGSVLVNNSAIGSALGFTLTGANNLAYQPVANLKLGSLADNGGPTQTIALLSGSPCINTGSNVSAAKTDQRGFPREVPAGKADIGAFESSGPLVVTNVQVNDGSVQRSRVTSITVTFSGIPSLPASPETAFQLKRADNASVSLAAVVTGNSVTLTFTAGAVDFGSLADGRYTLTVVASNVNSGNFDGDSNGAPGDDYVLVGDLANKLFRLFGDSDGDGDCDNNDFINFRAAFGTGSSIFNYDNDGDTDNADFGQFRARFGTSV